MTLTEWQDFLWKHGTDDWFHDNIVSAVLDEHGEAIATKAMDGELYLVEGENDCEDWENTLANYSRAEVEPLDNGMVNIVLYAVEAAREAHE